MLAPREDGLFRGRIPIVRGANSLPTGGREEVRAAGAGAQRGDQGRGRVRIRTSRGPVPEGQVSALEKATIGVDVADGQGEGVGGVEGNP